MSKKCTMSQLVQRNGNSGGRLCDELENLFKVPPKCPVDVFVTTVDVDAEMQEQVVAVKLKFKITVMKREEEITNVTLLPAGVAVSNITSKKLGKQDADKEAETDHGRVTFAGGSTVFFTTQQGMYEVAMEAQFPYATALKQIVNFSLPKATQCNLNAILPWTGLEVTVPQAVTVKSDVVDGKTKVQAVIPPSDVISVKWLKQAIEKPKYDDMKPLPLAKPKPVKEMLLTSGQDYLHSIGGGVCVTTLHQHFTITNGSVSSFVLEIGECHGSAPHQTSGYNDLFKKGKHVRVLAVDGPGLQKWDIAENTEKKGHQVLKLQMESAVEGVIHFVITAEIEMISTSCMIGLPSFHPPAANRSKGNIAIQARTAVEIQEVEVRRLSKVDVKEMPPKLSGVHNILHAYKFLNTGYALVLNVIKHNDVDVLVATAEQGVYRITHTGEHLFYHIGYNVRNTQRQFARVKVPSGSTIWSALSNGSAVKPAVDSSGETLIPLVKSSENLFSAELVFVKKAVLPAFESETDLNIEIPTIDIPVNHLCVELWMPHKNHYGQWHGDLQEVSSWSVNPVLCGQPPASVITGDEWSYQLNTNACVDDSDSCSSTSTIGAGEATAISAGDLAVGIKPLTFRTTPLRTGRAFYLEKLLLAPKTSIKLECKTCQAEKVKPRTLKDQQPKQCIVM
eukprot:TRINITY_DN6295_c0_g1_i1.p1 TRINITY_DN6295_c0_g1~~TRINITY_DN6295_c0_g1_i1.p1  ORF type:complete len:677 (+),score=118.31 TRINITY_DN6295_c0_g1_i1:56-2086(+)